eukprot:7523707-Pyramimonas_sp.AAC.1
MPVADTNRGRGERMCRAAKRGANTVAGKRSAVRGPSFRRRRRRSPDMTRAFGSSPSLHTSLPSRAYIL